MESLERWGQKVIQSCIVYSFMHSWNLLSSENIKMDTIVPDLEMEMMEYLETKFMSGVFKMSIL